jgi:hypothetical protein
MANLPFKEASPQEATELVKIADLAIKEFEGPFDELEKAIGMLLCGRKVGWKVLLLIHDKKTIRKYEEILGINIREFFPEVGPWAHKSVAWKLVQKVTNFWKAVSGDIPGVRTPEITR